MIAKKVAAQIVKTIPIFRDQVGSEGKGLSRENHENANNILFGKGHTAAGSMLWLPPRGKQGVLGDLEETNFKEILVGRKLNSSSTPGRSGQFTIAFFVTRDPLSPNDDSV